MRYTLSTESPEIEEIEEITQAMRDAAETMVRRRYAQQPIRTAETAAMIERATGLLRGAYAIEGRWAADQDCDVIGLPAPPTRLRQMEAAASELSRELTALKEIHSRQADAEACRRLAQDRAQRLEAERLEAERLEAERLAARRDWLVSDEAGHHISYLRSYATQLPPQNRRRLLATASSLESQRLALLAAASA